MVRTWVLAVAVLLAVLLVAPCCVEAHSRVHKEPRKPVRKNNVLVRSACDKMIGHISDYHGGKVFDHYDLNDMADLNTNFRVAPDVVFHVCRDLVHPDPYLQHLPADHACKQPGVVGCRRVDGAKGGDTWVPLGVVASERMEKAARPGQEEHGLTIKYGDIVPRKDDPTQHKMVPKLQLDFTCKEGELGEAHEHDDNTDDPFRVHFVSEHACPHYHEDPHENRLAEQQQSDRPVVLVIYVVSLASLAGMAWIVIKVAKGGGVVAPGKRQ